MDFVINERLKRLFIPSLELSRLHADLIWCIQFFLAA